MTRHGFLEDDGRTMRRRMLDGDDYIADDPELTAASRRAIRLAAAYAGVLQSRPAPPAAPEARHVTEDDAWR